jgi:hypothetical protein
MSEKRSKPETLEGLVGEAIGGIADEAAQKAAREREEAEARERKDRRNRIVAAVLLPVCIVLTALNLFGLLAPSPEPPARTAGDTRLAQLELLSDAVDEIDFYHRENGRYPTDPGFFGPDGPDGEDEPFAYELMGSDRYVVSVTVDGLTMSFDSREDADAVFREVRDAR